MAYRSEATNFVYELAHAVENPADQGSADLLISIAQATIGNTARVVCARAVLNDPQQVPENRQFNALCVADSLYEFIVTHPEKEETILSYKI